MLRRIVTFAIVTTLAGCGARADLEQIRGGIPQNEDATVPLPESQALVGQTAEMYTVTRDATRAVNGGVVWVLGLLKAIVSLPPTSHDGATYTWGPSTPKGLEAKNNWMLVATANDDGSVTYALEAKKVEEPASAFRAIISGTHTRGEAPRTGHGEFTLDFDQAQTLNQPGKDVGVASVTYGRQASSAYRIDVAFKQIFDRTQQKRVDATYHNEEAADGHGSFTFATAKDVSGDDHVPEALEIKSRWMATGAGRSDVKASGGSLAQPATFNQCWDDGFVSVFENASWDATKNAGDAAKCAFAEAEYPDVM